jgi:aminoglycoside phosphotransferase (APT) family kinase protein
VFAWGRDAVAKVPFASTPEAWIHFEADYTAAVHDAGAPTPRLLGIETIAGREASIYERVHGRSMWDHMLDRPDQIPAHARTLAALQADLFTLIAPVSLPSLRDRLRCKILAASRQIDTSLAGALDLVPNTSESRLCHGDLHPGNVLLAASGPVIVDWFDAARGDHVADIARTSLLMSARAHGASGPRHLPSGGRTLLDRARGAYLHAISELVGMDADDLRRWEAVVAAARLAEGIARDALLGIWHEQRPGAAALAARS